MMMFPMMNPNIGNGDYFTNGLKTGSDLYKNFVDSMTAHLANQKAKALLPYAVQHEQAEIGEIKNRAGLSDEQAKQISFLLSKEGQGYLAGGDAAQMQYLRNLSHGNIQEQAGQPQSNYTEPNATVSNIPPANANAIQNIGQRYKSMFGAQQNSLPASYSALQGQGTTSLLPRDQEQQQAQQQSQGQGVPTLGQHVSSALDKILGSNSPSPMQQAQQKPIVNSDASNEVLAPKIQEKANSNILDYYAENPYGYESPKIPHLPGVGEDPYAQIISGNIYAKSPEYKKKLDAWNKRITGEDTLWSKDLDSASKAGQSSIVLDSAINDAYNQYEDLGILQKGPVGGRIPAISDAATKFETDVKGAIPDLVKTWQQARITNQDIRLVEEGKMTRKMSEKGIKSMKNMINSYNKRAQEYEDFINKAKSLNLPRRIRDNAWFKYNDQRRPYDVDKAVRNTKYDDTWGDYLTPEAISAEAKGNPYTPPGQEITPYNSGTNKKLTWSPDKGVHQ